MLTSSSSLLSAIISGFESIIVTSSSYFIKFSLSFFAIKWFSTVFLRLLDESFSVSFIMINSSLFPKDFLESLDSLVISWSGLENGEQVNLEESWSSAVCSGVFGRAGRLVPDTVVSGRSVRLTVEPWFEFRRLWKINFKFYMCVSKVSYLKYAIRLLQFYWSLLTVN